MLFRSANIPTITKRKTHAERKSSLPRLSAPIRSNFDDLQQRPRSVDADLMIESIHCNPLTRVARGNNSDTCSDMDTLRFAELTSTKQYMMSRDKSSSGNSSGSSDVAVDTDTDTGHGHLPVLRGHQHIVTPRHHRPPRHLLPAKLKPSPGVKCHPFVMLPHQHRDRKSTRLNSSHSQQSRMPSSA